MTPGTPIPPTPSPVPFAELAATLARLVDADAFPDDPPIITVPGDRDVARLGFVLEPAPGLAEWVRSESLDALFLHRPWGVEDAGLPDGVGVLASHAAFDARMAIGADWLMIPTLEMYDIHRIRDERSGAPGIVGKTGYVIPDLLIAYIREKFGALEEVVPGTATRIRRIAIVGAMTDALVRQAAAMEVDLYLTGQIRHPARAALAETGMAAIGIGHRRSEEYALHTLAFRLEEEFPGRLSTIVRSGGAVPA